MTANCQFARTRRRLRLSLLALSWGAALLYAALAWLVLIREGR